MKTQGEALQKELILKLGEKCCQKADCLSELHTQGILNTDALSDEALEFLSVIFGLKAMIHIYRMEIAELKSGGSPGPRLKGIIVNELTGENQLTGNAKIVMPGANENQKRSLLKWALHRFFKHD